MRRAGVLGYGWPYSCGADSSGISALTRVPPPGGAVDCERSFERGDAVGEPAQAGSARCIGAADAVVGDLDARAAVLVADAHGDSGRIRVLAHVRERLRDHVVGGRFDGARERLIGRLDVDRDGRACRERLDRRPEAAVGEHGRVDSARELAQVVESSRELLPRRHEDLLRRRWDPSSPSTARAAARARARRVAAERRRGGSARVGAAPRRRPRRSGIATL